MDRRFLSFAAVVALAAAGAACSPVTSYSGFRPDYNNVQLADPQVGVDTKQTIEQRFGAPSTTAIFDQTAWYYVSSAQQQVAFNQPRVTERNVMVVRFNGDTVSAVEKYGIERGRIVSYDDHVTPTRGRELGLIEQLFGNIGQTPPIRTEEQEQGGRPDNRR